MKTYNKISLPDSILYKGETYTINIEISAVKTLSNTPVKAVNDALKSTGKKGILVKCMHKSLKGKTDFHGNPYKPSEWIYTN